MSTLDRGEIPCIDVREGDRLLAWDFVRNAPTYRRVTAVKHAEANTWYAVDGYRMSPLDPVWYRGKWRMPHAVGVPDHGPGVRVRITVEGANYDACNYYLVGRRRYLLIHNIQMLAC